MILTITAIISQNSIIRLIFVMEKRCVCCEEGHKLLHAAYTDLMRLLH